MSLAIGKLFGAWNFGSTESGSSSRNRMSKRASLRGGRVSLGNCVSGNATPILDQRFRLANSFGYTEHYSGWRIPRLQRRYCVGQARRRERHSLKATRAYKPESRNKKMWEGRSCATREGGVPAPRSRGRDRRAWVRDRWRTASHYNNQLLRC